MAASKPNPALHLVAPLMTFGATYLVRKAITIGYQRMTGKAAPDPHERRTPIGTAFVWAAATAAATALVEVAVYRMTSQD